MNRICRLFGTLHADCHTPATQFGHVGSRLCRAELHEAPAQLAQGVSR